MDWGGIIAGALGGGAQAATDIANNQIAQNSKIDLMKEQAEIEKQKAAYADELSRKRALWDLDTGPDGYATKKTAVDTAREKSLQGVRTDAAVDQATRLIPVEVQREQQVGALRAENAGKEIGARLSAETAENLKRFNNPEYIRGLGAQARATHIESAASIEQAALARLQRTNLEDTQRLQRALSDARRIEDPDARDAAVSKLQQEISDKAFTGKDTGKAYSAYIAASTKLIDLQAKIDDPTKPISDADKARLNAEMAETRAVMQQAAKDLGVKTPDAKSAGGPGPNVPPLDSFNKGGAKPPAPAKTAANSQQDGWADVKASMQPLVDKYNKAREQLRLAARSQDPNSVIQYAKKVQEATEALRSEAQQRLGNQAPSYLSGIIQ